MVDELRNNAYGLYGQYQNFANSIDGGTWALGERGPLHHRRRHAGARQPVQGKPLHRQGDAGLAGRPLQPAQAGRRVHPVRHRQLQLPRLPTSSSPTRTSRSRSGGTPSSRTGSTWATWWSSAGSATTGTTPAPAGPSRTDTAGQHLRLPARLHDARVRHGQPDRAVRAGPEPRLPEPPRPGVVPGHRPDQLPALATRTRCRRRTSRCCWAASTSTSATPTPTRCTAPTWTSARPSPSSSASGTPSATTWCWTWRRTTRTSCAIRRPGWSRCSTRPAAGDNDFRILTNLDFGNVRGIDVRLDRRFGNFFNGTIAYAYQQAKNTGSDPFTYTNYGSRIVNQVGGNNGAQPPPQGILPTDDSRPHTLAGRVLGHPAGRLAQGHGAGRHPAQRERVLDLPLHQRHGVHQVRREQRRAERALHRELRPALPRGAQHPAAPGLQGAEHAGSPRASGWAGWT